jgi:hypothetical protein
MMAVLVNASTRQLQHFLAAAVISRFIWAGPMINGSALS